MLKCKDALRVSFMGKANSRPRITQLVRVLPEGDKWCPSIQLIPPFSHSRAKDRQIPVSNSQEKTQFVGLSEHQRNTSVQGVKRSIYKNLPRLSVHEGPGCGTFAPRFRSVHSLAIIPIGYPQTTSHIIPVSSSTRLCMCAHIISSRPSDRARSASEG